MVVLSCFMFLRAIYNVDTTSLAYAIVLFDWYRLPIALFTRFRMDWLNR